MPVVREEADALLQLDDCCKKAVYSCFRALLYPALQLHEFIKLSGLFWALVVFHHAKRLLLQLEARTFLGVSRLAFISLVCFRAPSILRCAMVRACQKQVRTVNLSSWITRHPSVPSQVKQHPPVPW